MLDRRLLVTCASLLAVVVGSGAAALFSYDHYARYDHAQATQVVSAVAGAVASSPEPDYLYIIREYDGRVAVFARGQSTPEMVLDRLVHHLPTYDRLQLREGVPVFTKEELQERIEDYTS